MIPVAIIGAGIARRVCARRLAQAGLAPVLFEKRRGIGGRVATRRVEALHFDHGAQYMTAQGQGFAGVLAKLAATGADGASDDGLGPRRVAVTPGMSALAAGLEVLMAAEVSAIVPSGQRWALRFGETEQRTAQGLVTVPAPQVAGLKGEGHPQVAALAPVGIGLDPCPTLMAATPARPRPLRRVAIRAMASPGVRGTVPGRAAPVTRQRGCRRRGGLSAGRIRNSALPLLCGRMGIAPDRATFAATHRRRHARVLSAPRQPFLRRPDGRLYPGGERCLGPRVGAVRTCGTAIADDLLACLS